MGQNGTQTTNVHRELLELSPFLVGWFSPQNPRKTMPICWPLDIHGRCPCLRHECQPTDHPSCQSAHLSTASSRVAKSQRLAAGASNSKNQFAHPNTQHIS